MGVDPCTMTFRGRGFGWEVGANQLPPPLYKSKQLRPEAFQREFKGGGGQPASPPPLQE